MGHRMLTSHAFHTPTVDRVTAHRFQTPLVRPCAALAEELPEGVLLRVTRADAERILRALEETSSHLAISPDGTPVASSYRRLAADIRVQTNGSDPPSPRLATA